jgi:protein-S-isoprenylcysteine O-methyltransferase Ste14
MLALGTAWFVLLPLLLLRLAGSPGLRPPLRGPLALALAGPLFGAGLPLDPTRRLVVAGAYRHVRNPQALAMLAMSAAEALAVDAAALLLLPVLTLGYLLAVGPGEERQLAAAFGPEYLRYRAQVRKWLPRRRPYQAP